MNENNIQEKDELVDLTVRENLTNAIEKILTVNDATSAQFENFLELVGEGLSEDALGESTTLLADISEHINVFRRLIKVLKNPEDLVYTSDIEVCEDFFQENNQLISKINTFTELNKK